MKSAGVAIALLLTFGACEDSSSTDAIPEECGLPTPDADVDAALVPDHFLLEGAEVTKAQRTKERLTVAINNPHGVTESFDQYKGRMKTAGYQLVGLDNEGFEAEIYLRKGKQLGAIQIRTSRCPEATVTFVNLLET